MENGGGEGGGVGVGVWVGRGDEGGEEGLGNRKTEVGYYDKKRRRVRSFLAAIAQSLLCHDKNRLDR
jgi:hypothetical protein